jgi:hypothetical protein
LGQGSKEVSLAVSTCPVCGNTGSGQCAGRDPKCRQPDTGRQRSPSRRASENAVEVPFETHVAGFRRAYGRTDPHRGRRIGRQDISSWSGGIRDIRSTEPKEAGLGAARGNACQSTGFNFPGVTEISPEAAAALGSLPDAEYRGPDGTVEVRPSGDLNFPSLEELSPETARLLLRKRWLSISLPALQDVSLETVRLMARQTFRLNLGIPALPPEFADAFARDSD